MNNVNFPDNGKSDEQCVNVVVDENPVLARQDETVEIPVAGTVAPPTGMLGTTVASEGRRSRHRGTRTDTIPVRKEIKKSWFIQAKVNNVMVDLLVDT